MLKNNALLKKLIGISLLILCFFIAALISFGFLIFFPHYNTRKKVAETNIKSFEAALTAYYTTQKKYPTTHEGLEKVIIYLRDNKIPLDPWNNEYYYEKNEEGYTIVSMGPDGILFTTDDIWNKGAIIKQKLIYAKDPNIIWKLLLLFASIVNILIIAFIFCLIRNTKITIKNILLMCPFSIGIFYTISIIITALLP